MTKILSVKKTEEDGVTIWERVVKDEVWGRIVQRLVIDPQRVVALRSWMDRHYSETRLEKVVLSRPVRWNDRDVSVVLTYVRGHEGEGNNHWYGVDIVPSDPRHVDAFLQSIKDFDTWWQAVTCLRNTCRDIGYTYVVDCDISPCLQTTT